MNKRQRNRARLDGYANAVLGMGNRAYDPYVHFNVSVLGDRMDNYELEKLFTYNGVANKIVTCPVDDAIRAGFQLKDGDEKIIEDAALQSKLEDLKLNIILREALTWNRLFGGALIVFTVDDGGVLDEPLNVNKIRNIAEIRVYNPTDISINTRYEDTTSSNYGQPETYTINNAYAGSFTIHESRTIRLTGELITQRERNLRDGWGGNVLERMRSDLMNYGVSLRNALMALQRMSQGVLKLNALQSIVSSADGEALVQKRINLIDQARSIDNTVVLDIEDAYELHNISLGGITDVISIFQTSLSAVCDIPITRLFGQSPKGLNSTGKSDMDNYYNMVDGIRTNQMRPVILQILEFINNASDYSVNLPTAYTIKFNPLEMINEKEVAETEKLEAESQKLEAEKLVTYMQAGAMDAMEIRENISEKYILKNPIVTADDALDEELPPEV